MGNFWGSPAENQSSPSTTRNHICSGKSQFLTSNSDESSYTNGEILATSNLKEFTFQELKTATRNFKGDTLLGEGGFGRVYKGWLENKHSSSKSGSGLVVAIKKLNSESIQGFEEWQSEVDFLGRLSHQNLVTLLGYCQEDNKRLLVYEFMQKGSLEIQLFGRAVQPLPWDLRLKIIIGAARGLAFLHSSCVMCRDIKVSNILVDGSYNGKISDFGLPKWVPSASQSHVTTQVICTNGYTAPEYVTTGHRYVESDVYAFGVVLVELLTGLRAFDFNRPKGKQALVDWIKPLLSDKRKLKSVMDARLTENYPSKAAIEIAELALKCLAWEPRARPSMQEVVAILEKIQGMDHEKPKVASRHSTAGGSSIHLQGYPQQKDSTSAFSETMAFDNALISNQADPSEPFTPILQGSNSIKLTATNFVAWRTQIQATLLEYDLWKFVNGSHPSPPTSITTDDGTSIVNPAALSWFHQDYLVFGAIVSTLSQDIVPLVSRTGTAEEAWNVLSQAFATQHYKQFKGHLSQITHTNQPTSSYMQAIKQCTATA